MEEGGELLARERALVLVGEEGPLHGAVYVRTAGTHLGIGYYINTVQYYNQRTGDSVRLGYLSRSQYACFQVGMILEGNIFASRYLAATGQYVHA